MKADIAAEVSRSLYSQYKHISEVLCMIDENCSQEEFNRYKGEFARIMGHMVMVLESIYREHPQLRPPELQREKGADKSV